MFQLKSETHQQVVLYLYLLPQILTGSTDALRLLGEHHVTRMLLLSFLIHSFGFQLLQSCSLLLHSACDRLEERNRLVSRLRTAPPAAPTARPAPACRRGYLPGPSEPDLSQSLTGRLLPLIQLPFLLCYPSVEMLQPSLSDRTGVMHLLGSVNLWGKTNSVSLMCKYRKQTHIFKPITWL